jgi:hypothetical protein
MSTSIHRLFGAAATLAVLGALVWGFVVVGGPASRRTERMDGRRLDDLRAIHAEIVSLVRDPQKKDVLKQPLPKTLAELASRARYRKISLNDPETAEPYEFRVTGDSTYVLCATFARAREATHDVFWNHGAGHHCFTIDAKDPP